MAAGGTDGSLKFDTAINIEGFEKGISTLSKAMDKLSSAVDRLSGNIVQSFNGAGQSAEGVGTQAEAAAEKVDGIAESAKRAKKETKSMAEQMEAITVEHYEAGEPGGTEEPELPRTSELSGKYRQYGDEVQQFVDDYEKNMGRANQSANEFKRHIEELGRSLKDMESRGLYFGDDEYDETYLKLSKVKQALADYKKEMLSPAESKAVLDSGTLQGEVDKLRGELKRLAGSGKTFGDSLYDSTYASLAKAEAALKEYRKNLTSPNELMIVLDESTLQGKIESLKRKLDELKLQGKTWGDGEFDGVYQSLSQAQKELREYQKSLASANETQRLQEIARDAQVSSQEVAALNGRLAELKARQKELASAGLGAGYREYDDATMEIQKATQAIRQHEAYLKNLAELSARSAEKISQEGLAAGMTAEEMSRLAREKAGASTENKMLGKKADETSAKVEKEGTSASRLTKLLGMASKSLSRIGNAFAKSGKQAKAGGKGMSAMIGRMMLFSVVHKLISGIGKAFKEGIQNYAGYSKGFNGIMSSFVASLSQLKNSFAAAFSPVASVAIPMLDALVQKMVQVINVVGQMLAALAGKGTFTRAVKVNQDYAASLKKTGGAASQAGKDAKKALAPFDDLVQIQQQGADASGGGGGGATDPSQMFEEASVDGGIKDFADKIRAAFEAGDYSGIGKIIGDKINEQVSGITEYIDWENCGSRISSIINGFTGMFNSLVATIDWYAVGAMFGTGINTLANTMYLLIAGMDWGLLGTAFGTGLNGVFDTIDWALMGLLLAAGLNGLVDVVGNAAATFDWSAFGGNLALSLSVFFQNFDWAGSGTLVSDVVIGLLDALIAFVTETDWMAFGEGVAEMLVNIDWPTIASRLYEAFGAALGAVFGLLAGFLGELISSGVEGAKAYFGKKIDECGGNVALGILVGMASAFSDIRKWVVDNMFKPFLDGFLKAFGISGGTSALERYGKDLWDGFCKGIKEFFANPGDFIKANITDPFVNGIKSLLGIHSPSTVLAGIGSNTVAGFDQGVTNEQGASQNVVQSWASGVASWFKDKFGIGSGDSDESKKWASGIMGGFNSSISGNYKNSQGVMETWAENVRKWFMGTDGSRGVNEPSWTKFADLVIQAFKTKIEGSHAESQAPMEAWARNAREWFWGDANPEGTGGMYEAFYNMARRINEGFANGISDFAYMAKEAIRRWASEAMEAAEEEFDINSPSKEFYGIAEYVVRGFNDGIGAMASSSRNTVQKWLDGVLDVFDGVDVQLPIGVNIPNAASYLPGMAKGTVVPPRAGEMSAGMRSMAGYGQEEAMGYLISKMDEMISRLQSEGNRPIQVVLNLTGNLAALARVLKPELDKEAARKGVSLVIVGG